MVERARFRVDAFDDRISASFVEIVLIEPVTSMPREPSARLCVSNLTIQYSVLKFSVVPFSVPGNFVVGIISTVHKCTGYPYRRVL